MLTSHKTKLERLLAVIDPGLTIDPTYERANQAINAYHWPQAYIEDWNTFKQCMGQYYGHLMRYLLRLETVHAETEYLWQHCEMVLHRIYGKNGEKAAFEYTRTGNEGGLNAVLRAVAMAMAEDSNKREVSSRILSVWNELGVDEKFDLMEEYFDKYGHLYSTELTERGAVRLKANFIGVLENHPHLIKQLRKVGR